MLNIYVANLAEYTKGNMLGGWVVLPDTSEALQHRLDAVVGKDAEELIILDYDTNILKLKVSEYENVHQLNEKMQELQEATANQEEARTVTLIADYEGLKLDQAIAEFTDGNYFVVEADTPEELAEKLYDDGLLSFEIPDNILPYFDFEKLGRDYVLNGDAIDLGREEGIYLLK